MAQESPRPLSVRELLVSSAARCARFGHGCGVWTVNRVRSWRNTKIRRPATGIDPTDQFLSQLEDPGSAISVRWDREHDRHVFDKLLATVRPGCEPATWEAFRLFAIEGRSATEAAALTGLTENARDAREIAALEALAGRKRRV